jgi:hypothetical protein
MSWASRKRATYGFSVFLFFLITVGGPVAYWYLTIPPTCTDGKQNQGETSPDHGGPCLLLDAGALTPAPVLWSRSFPVRDGSFNSVAYIQNENANAGVRRVSYRFALYDTENVLVAEREGSTFIMPGAITPVFESGIQTGNRVAVRTYFIFTDDPKWERMVDRSRIVVINDKEIADTSTAPHLSATAFNSSVLDMTDVLFIATIFDQAGNAFATSQTKIPKLRGGEKQEITFTWPDPFTVTVGRIDIIPLVVPGAPKQ